MTQELVTDFSMLDPMVSSDPFDFYDLLRFGQTSQDSVSWEIQDNPQYLSLVKPGAEAIAAIAKNELETGKSFDPELANPVYLKTPEYQKKWSVIYCWR